MFFGSTFFSLWISYGLKWVIPSLLFRNSNHMLLNFHLLIVLVHRFFSNTKISKITSKVDANATGFPMGLNDDDQ